MSIFRRRHKRALILRLLEFLWPRMGWRRAGKYYGYRIKRLPGTPYSIACGFACGAAVSFTPFLGFHFLLGAFLAWGLRGSLIASAIGTAVGNPWTFPGIWFGVLWIGSKLLGRPMPQLSFSDLSITLIFDQFSTIGVPMLVGGVPAGLIAWVLFFIPIRRVISNYQTRRHAMRVKRQQFLAEQSQQKQSDLTDGYSHNVDELTIPSSKVIEQSAQTHTPMNTNTKDRKSR